MKPVLAICAALAALISSPVFAEEATKDAKAAQPQRENMAAMHEQMAVCLRSDKPLNVCRSQLRENCKAMGEKGCPMMGHMDGMKGHGKKGHSSG